MPANASANTPGTPAATRSQGIALVLCAPSGTGKSTLVKLLLQECGNLTFSVSCTTRAPREGEQNGVHYHFISQEEFLRRRDSGDMLEWAEVHGNYYGTSKTVVQDVLDKGTDLILDIDVQGAMQVREKIPGACLVFILPPSRQELEQRLTGRGTDAPEVIAKRLANAWGELEKAPGFDYLVVNDDLENAKKRLKAILTAERSHAARNAEFLHTYLQAWQAS